MAFVQGLVPGAHPERCPLKMCAFSVWLLLVTVTTAIVLTSKLLIMIIMVIIAMIIVIIVINGNMNRMIVNIVI